jgi:hypothetical protein
MTLNPQGWRKTLARKLEEESGALKQADDYYMGRQPLRYLDPEVRRQLGGRLDNVVVNWPRLVVDAIEERLNIVGIRNGDDEASDLWRIWQANAMDEYSERAHADALVYGRSYAMVWASPDPATPRISIESPLQVCVERDPYDGTVVASLKQWLDATKRWRALLITQDKVVQFRSDIKSDAAMPPPSNESAWIQYSTEDNPLGVVPIVPIVNRPRTMHPDGESELADVFPLADAVNKLCTDLMVSAEYSAMPRRWITGMFPMGSNVTQQQADDMSEKVRNMWETARGSKIWIAPNEQTKMGQFPEAQLEGFVNAIRLFSMQVAAISGLPPHYLGLVSDNPASADAIRSAEASLVFRAMRRQRIWSQAWVDVLKLAVQVRDGVPPVGMDELEIVWENPETRTPGQMADYALKLVQAGIVDRGTVLEDLGYTPSKIERIGGYS